MVKRRTQYHHAVRRVKRRCDEVRARELFVAAMKGDTDLVRETKKVRSGGSGAVTTLPDNVAGVSGEENIVVKFSEVYSTLYNSAGTRQEWQI